MAISVSIPKEITEYEEKIMFGLSLRKLCFFVLAVILAIGTYMLCTMVFGLSTDLTSYIIIFEAMPLMALGFIKKDGMSFEKYAALIIRHKIGLNKLAYECETIFKDENKETTENEENEERKSKYDWIFKNKANTNGKQLTRKELKTAKLLREAKIFEITKKSRKKKCKATRREIKAAKQDYRAVKRRTKKADKESCRTKEHCTTS